MTQAKNPEPQHPPRSVTYVALKPRLGLTIILAIVFAAWVALMVYWYITTVRPMRHQQPIVPHPTETRP
jgi:hypothetical protein